MIIKKWFIPGEIFSLNKLYKLHWRTRSKYNKRWEHSTSAIVGWGDGPEKIRSLSLICVVKRTMDEFDNIRAGLKPVIDTLVKKKWLKDDSPKWLSSPVNISQQPRMFSELGLYIELSEE